MRLLPQTHCLEEEEKQKTKIESQPFRANGLSISYRRRSLRKARVSLPQRPESVKRGPRGVPDAPSTRGKKLSKKLGRGGRSTQGPSVFRARTGARQLSVGATPRIARPGAQGRDLILCPQPAGSIAASAGSSVDASAPRSPKVSWWVQQTRERAAAAASSPRPPPPPVARRPRPLSSAAASALPPNSRLEGGFPTPTLFDLSLQIRA